MKASDVLFTEMLPASLEEGQDTFREKIEALFSTANRVDIAVGYVSRASLLELDTWIHKYKIVFFRLVIGMYYLEGMPESSYHTAMELGLKWKDEGIGEIRLVRAFKYHGKVYAFYREDGTMYSGIVGSANLGAIKPEANNRRQYEIALVTTDAWNCTRLYHHLNDLCSDACSADLLVLHDVPLIREHNMALENIDLVQQVSSTDVELYRDARTELTFVLPIKVL